jgi:hypothetical protein
VTPYGLLKNPPVTTLHRPAIYSMLKNPQPKRGSAQLSRNKDMIARTCAGTKDSRPSPHVSNHD